MANTGANCALWQPHPVSAEGGGTHLLAGPHTRLAVAAAADDVAVNEHGNVPHHRWVGNGLDAFPAAPHPGVGWSTD